MTDQTDTDALVERIALIILNSDREAGGWPAVANRDNIENSDGYLRNARAIAAMPEATTQAAKIAALTKRVRVLEEAGTMLATRLRETKRCDLARGLCGAPNFGDPLDALETALASKGPTDG